MIRGEIWWVDFGLPIGSEVGFERPVVILQNDFLNESNLMTTVVVPLTTNMLILKIIYCSKNLRQIFQKIQLLKLTL